MNRLLQDVRYALRVLAKNPSFSLIALFALAFSIGANTAIFSVVNSLLIKPLAYGNPDRLVRINNRDTKTAGINAVSPPGFADYRDKTSSYESMSAVYLGNIAMNFSEQGDPERLDGGRVSANFFDTLRVGPALGRTFVSEEDEPGRNRVVVLSYGLWQRRFGGDPAVVGRDIVLSGQSYVVIGVMPQGFQFDDNDLWRPLALARESFAPNQRGSEYLKVIARLKPGISIAQAQSEMDTLAANIKDNNPDFYPKEGGWGVGVTSLHEETVGSIKPTLLILLGAVGFVLLIACANVANLLIARAAARQKEIAIRTALGASRVDLIRQLLTESLLLSLAGGAVGLLLAIWGVRGLVTLGGKSIPRSQEIGIDARVLGFTVMVSVLTAILFGLVPAIRASRCDLQTTLKEGGRGSWSGTKTRARSLLVIADVALSLVLLIGAGLLIKSFSRIQSVSPGFESKGVLTMQLSLPTFKYREAPQIKSFFETTLEGIRALPGVQSAGAVSDLPLSGSVHSGSFNIEGRPTTGGEEGPHADIRSATPDYFQTMKIPLISGRFFTERDLRDSEPVAIIDETLAQRYFPGEDPIGKRVEFQPGKPIWRQIVGVVGHLKHQALDADYMDQLYSPHAQVSNWNMFLVVRSATDPLSLVSAVREVVRSVDKDQPVYKVRTMDQLLSSSLAQRRLAVILLGVFAAVALMLAAVGLYGVISYGVTQRTNEIGIRMALGAERGQIFQMVLGQGIGLTIVGIGIGLIGAFGLTRVMTSMLFGVTATDPWTFAVIPVVLGMVALAACFVPARRATRVDPMVALREQ
jgi:putative ABC transport system permease protein